MGTRCCRSNLRPPGRSCPPVVASHKVRKNQLCFLRGCLRSRFSAWENSMTICWWRFTQPAKIISRNASAEGESMPRSLLPSSSQFWALRRILVLRVGRSGHRRAGPRRSSPSVSRAPAPTGPAHRASTDRWLSAEERLGLVCVISTMFAEAGRMARPGDPPLAWRTAWLQRQLQRK